MPEILSGCLFCDQYIQRLFLNHSRAAEETMIVPISFIQNWDKESFDIGKGCVYCLH